ncbi:hypothetical protein AAD018_009885 [Aestuariibius insulae]|uniref:hypothetical protein n=1 Tax=Aestuariibius insulae TaxID=2058287 RepID=UPI00345F1009
MTQDLTIALHAGAHKTATTHLQRTLMDNKVLLERAGITFRGPNAFRNPGETLRHMFEIGRRMEDPFPGGPLALLKKLAAGRKRLIISEENFFGSLNPPDGPFRRHLYRNGPGRLEILAARVRPHPIDLFFAVRDQATFMQSAHSQVLLSGRRVSLDEYLNGLRPEQISWFSLIEELVNKNAARRIWIWRYEDYPAVQEKIYANLLTCDIASRIVPHPKQVNQSLSRAAVKACLSDSPGSPSGQEARMLHPVSDVNPRYEGFSSEARRLSRARYENDLVRIEELKGVQLLKP